MVNLQVEEEESDGWWIKLYYYNEKNIVKTLSKGIYYRDLYFNEKLRDHKREQFNYKIV